MTQILEGSIAQEMGIEAGDVLLAINDRQVQDIFDYQYLEKKIPQCKNKITDFAG